MEVSLRTWPTAHDDACDAKKERKPLKVWFHDEELELKVISIREHALGDQILLQSEDRSMVATLVTTTESDQVELSFYPQG